MPRPNDEVAALLTLVGMFAIAIVDSRAKKVFLARDPIGKKPLFLARWHTGAYFGSSVDCSRAPSSGR